MERLKIKRKTSKKSKFYSDEVTALAKKGNYGLKTVDPHSCCFCQKVFSSLANIKKHLVTFHIKSKKVSCDLCPKFYFTKAAIINHIKVHGKKIFSCNICDYRTPAKGHFQRHKLLHTAGVLCSICDKKVSVLKSHMRMHTETKKSCPICGKLFCNNSTMKHHLKSHKMRKCDKCEEHFESREDLRRWVSSAWSSKKFQFKC